MGFFMDSNDVFRPIKIEMSKLKIAVQKSGRLNEDSMKILKAIGISIDNGKDQLKASAAGLPICDARIFSINIVLSTRFNKLS